MAHILFVSLRDGEFGAKVAHAEREDVLRATGLESDELEMRVLSGTTAIGPVSDYSGIMVGGSSLNIAASDYTAWQSHIHTQLAELLESDRPVFLICFGLNWLVDHLGGTVGHSAPEVSGPTVVKPNDVPDPLLRNYPVEFAALTGHTENPEVIPPELIELATGPTGAPQMVRYGTHVWATQFHAEMDAAAMKTRMDFFYDYGYFPLTDYDTIVASLPSVDVRYANGLLRSFVSYCEDAV